LANLLATAKTIGHNYCFGALLPHSGGRKSFDRVAVEGTPEIRLDIY